MAVSKDYLEYILDQFYDWGGVYVRRLFGGAGLYRDGKMFALVADDIVYFKVDDTNREKYVLAGSSPFKPFPNRPSLSYYDVPPEILEDPSELIEWAKECIHIQRKKK